MKGERTLDARGIQEWLVVLGIGVGGLALAALATLTPWQGSASDWRPFGADRVVGIHLPVISVVGEATGDPR